MINKFLKLKENFQKSDLKSKYIELLSFSNSTGEYGIVELKKSILEPTTFHIFINGFTNDNSLDDEFDKWLQNSTFFSEKNDNLYGFKWASGQNFEEHLKNNAFDKSQNITNKLKELFPKIRSQAIALPVLSIQLVSEWKNVKSNSEKFSLELFEFIKTTKNTNPNIKINLYGHSLGANLIYHTLNKLLLENLQIENVYLFGGAVKNCEVSWAKSLKGCKNLYNFYSKNDDILSYMFRVAELGDKPIGLFPIESIDIGEDNENLYNFDVSEFVEGHSTYIDNLSNFFSLIQNPKLKFL